MSTLLWFLVIGGLFFLMMRMGCGSHVTGHGHGGHEDQKGYGGSVPSAGARRWAPPRTEIDPVCGVTVNTDSAKSSVHDGAVYYFCSAEHRDQFEADPGRYTGAKSGRQGAKELEHSDG